MGNSDRVSKAIDNLIDALNELKAAWEEVQDSYVPEVVISDEPPEGLLTPPAPDVSDEIPVQSFSEPMEQEEPLVQESSMKEEPVISFSSDEDISVVSFSDEAPDEDEPVPMQAMEPALAPAMEPNPEPVSEPTPVPSFDPTPEPIQIRFCGNCGGQLRPGVKFCSNCGTPQ